MNLNTHILDKHTYVIYTDGACIGNPGPGGWAAIIFNSEEKKVITGSDEQTTNNRMELIASIKALKIIKTKAKIKIFTDSKYLIDGISIWIKSWKLNNWKTKSKQNVKNLDLWKELDKLDEFHTIEWNWVKGHSGNKYNDEVDMLARSEAESI